MGTMGTCAWIARWNAPFLNGSRSGFVAYDRVPSGKMKTLCFSRRMCAAASSKAARAVVRFARSMKTVLERVTGEGESVSLVTRRRGVLGMVVGRRKMEERDVLNQPKNGIHFRLFLAVMLHQRGKTQPIIRTSSSLHPETRTLAIILLQTQLLLTIPPPIAPNSLSQFPAPASLPQFHYIQLPLLTLPTGQSTPPPNTKNKRTKPQKKLTSDDSPQTPPASPPTPPRPLSAPPPPSPPPQPET